MVKNPLLCLFHHVLTTIQLNFKNIEIKKIKGYASVGIRSRNPWGLCLRNTRALDVLRKLPKTSLTLFQSKMTYFLCKQSTLVFMTDMFFVTIKIHFLPTHIKDICHKQYQQVANFIYIHTIVYSEYFHSHLCTQYWFKYQTWWHHLHHCWYHC